MIVKIAVQHALDPNTERYMFASKSARDDKIKLSSYSNFTGELHPSKSLDLISEWVLSLFNKNISTLDEFNRYIRGYNIALWRAWEKHTNSGQDVVIIQDLFVRRDSVNENQIISNDD